MLRKPLFIVLLFCFSACSAPKIRPEEVRAYLNRFCQIEGKVVHTKKTASGTILLDLDKAHPNNALTVLIFPENVPNFPVSPEKYYEGKSVLITAKILADRQSGKPKVILRRKAEIRVLGN